MRSISRSQVTLAGLILFVVASFLILVPVLAQEAADEQTIIESAMSAAPPAIAEAATIMDNEGNILREGTNGWTCLPDLEASPDPDPICLDSVFMEWQTALIEGKEPEITTLGLAYMLQGGSDASNTDPMAMEPAEGEDWIRTPPHVMIVFPGDLDPELISVDHASGEPYIMWEGTPYEHVMMPVSLEAMEH